MSEPLCEGCGTSLDYDDRSRYCGDCAASMPLEAEIVRLRSQLAVAEERERALRAGWDAWLEHDRARTEGRSQHTAMRLNRAENAIAALAKAKEGGNG